MWKLVDTQLNCKIRYIVHVRIYSPINVHVWEKIQIPINIKIDHILMRT